MLTLILGKAGAGKTGAIINEIASAVAARQGQRILLVPEQYSHEAERELCSACGDSLSLYAEALSFTGLARRMDALVGGGSERLLDKGGRLLCMALALDGVGSRLKVYSAAASKAELQLELLGLIDQLKSAAISHEELSRAAEACDDALGDKLSDLVLIAEAYDAVVSRGRADPADRLTKLASRIEKGPVGAGWHIYVDGFVDFTAQQREVLRALMKKGAELTVCLTVESLHGEEEIYGLSRRAGRSLAATAAELGQETAIKNLSAAPEKAAELSFFADRMFTYSQERRESEGRIKLYRAESLSAQCEFAAAKALELVRDGGCRWRDIAVAVRGFDEYASALENMFEQYGVPLFVTKKSSLLSKPLPMMIALSYELIEGGWDVDDVISYLHTGLSGLEAEEWEELENYVFKWQLRASAWERKADWRQHPDGYGAGESEESAERLARINALRRRMAAPLLELKEKSGRAQTAAAQAQALADFFAALELPKLLSRRAGLLADAGREELSKEYQQLWELTVNALEQCAAVLGEMEMDRASFARLFTLMLSQYDVGTIPVSLDAVSAGDFDRMRRRSIKHLIVLGADDTRLPLSAENAGIFSESERRRLLELDIDLGAGGESELWREFTLIYNCLSLPSESLSLCYASQGGEGEEQRPAFVYRRAASLFSLSEEKVNVEKLRLGAPGPALSLAAGAWRGGDGAAQAAREYFRRREPGRCEGLERAANMTRGRLSGEAVRNLYGSRLRLSASRIDKFAQCKFAYFCQYGLRAKPYKPAGLTPPEVGSFMHYVLENVARDVKVKGGFSAVSAAELNAFCDKYVESYVHTELHDFQEKSARFTWLFRRLCRDVRQVVADMAEELKNSAFEPLDFELDFSKAQLEVPADGESVSLGGIADRVDGWLHGGKLYLRVVDYKTGKKKFSLSDLWYGMGLQMLLYLFTLEERGESMYGREVIPAGVMYVPARNAMLSATRDMDAQEIRKQLGTQLRRSGLVLEDAELIEAWEKGEDKRYIPIKFKKGAPEGDGLATAARMGLLSRHIKRLLKDMASQLSEGDIAADPYYRSQQENACLNCDYFDACHFADGENGESCRYQTKLKPEAVWNMLEGGGDNG